MGGAMCAALRRSEPAVAVAPPTARPRRAGWRDRRRAARPGVTAGRGVVVGRRVVFDVAPGGRVALADGVALGDGCRLHVAPGAEVSIGAGTRLGEGCVVTAHAGVAIGAGCLLADDVLLTDADPRFDDVERPVREQGLAATPIAVGADVRIGPAAALLPGVTVGDGAAIAAHAVVTRDVAAGAVVDGARVSPPPAPRPPARPARGGRAPR
jgi:acetyltransferase-like isoleucine patch superfamily enzyme